MTFKANLEMTSLNVHRMKFAITNELKLDLVFDCRLIIKVVFPEIANFTN